MMILDIIDSNIDFLTHMNKIYVTENFYLKVVEFSDELKYVTIKASKNSEFEPWFFETVSTTDAQRFADSMQILYGLPIEFTVRFKFSQETISKAQGLIQAGFSKLIREGENFTVDGTFVQNFLSQEELEYMLSLPETEFQLSEIK